MTDNSTKYSCSTLGHPKKQRRGISVERHIRVEKNLIVHGDIESSMQSSIVETQSQRLARTVELCRIVSTIKSKYKSTLMRIWIYPLCCAAILLYLAEWSFKGFASNFQCSSVLLGLGVPSRYSQPRQGVHFHARAGCEAEKVTAVDDFGERVLTNSEITGAELQLVLEPSLTQRFWSGFEHSFVQQFLILRIVIFHAGYCGKNSDSRVLRKYAWATCSTS